jgi:hypothetical protein
LVLGVGLFTKKSALKLIIGPHILIELEPRPTSTATRTTSLHSSRRSRLGAGGARIAASGIPTTTSTSRTARRMTEARTAASTTLHLRRALRPLAPPPSSSTSQRHVPCLRNRQDLPIPPHPPNAPSPRNHPFPSSERACR